MNELEKAAKIELISSYVQRRGNEWLYDQNAMLNMFRKGSPFRQGVIYNTPLYFLFSNLSVFLFCHLDFVISLNELPNK